MIRSIRPTPLRLSLLAALATLALILVVFAAYTAYAQGQEVTSTRDATGENPPAEPTNLQVSAEHDSVRLTWTASTDQTVTHHAVLRRDRSEDDVGVFHVIEVNAGPGLSHTDSSVSAGGSYVYRVKAISPTGVSRWSSYARADTPEPTPTATPEPTPTATPEPTPTATPEPTPTATPEPTPTATPEPTPTATPEPAPTATPEPAPTATPEPAPTATPEPAPTATPEPAPTATPEPTPTATPEPTPTATPAPTPEPDSAGSAPANLSAAPAGDGGVALAWDVPAEDAESVTGYEVLRAQGAGDLATLVADTGSAGTAHTDPTATGAGETYSYAVIALRGGVKSRQSNRATVGFPPARPTGLTTAATHDAVTLTWDATGDDSVTHYEAYRRVTGQNSLGDFDLIESDTGSAETAYTDDDVSPETRYTYRVKAVNAHGASRWSGYSSVTTLEAPAPESIQEESAPSPQSDPDPSSLAPTGLRARAVSADDVSAGIELSWNAPAEDAQSVTGYEILRARGDAKPATLVADTGSTDTSFTDGGATEAGESYVFRVKAVRGQERSQASEEARASVPQLASSRSSRSVATGSQSAEVTRQQIWSATVTVSDEGSLWTGFDIHSGNSSISENTITVDSVGYTIRTLALSKRTGALVIDFFHRTLPQALVNRFTLVAGGNEYQFANAFTLSGSERNRQFRWNSPGLSWSDDDLIPVSVKEEQNVDASGTDVILGKPYVGQTLTADTSGIEDPNGVPNRFSYQWKAGNADIPGATGSTYTLQREDKGKAFKVEVSFTDDAGYDESLTSGATPAVGEQIREVWTAKMTVGTGPNGQLGYHQTDYEGSSLTDTSFTTSAGDHTVRQVSIHGSETRFTVTGELPEAAEESWPLYLGNLQFPLANASKQTSVLVTAFSWSQPKPAWQSGDKVDVALWRVNLPAGGAPAIKGATEVSDLLSVDTTRIRDSDGIPEDVAFTYQWFSRDGDEDVDIPGATGSSYVVTGQEPSNFLRVRVGFTDGNGFQEIVVSNAAVWPQLGEIWTAALTAGRNNSTGKYGFGANYEGGALSDTTFNHADNDHTLIRVAIRSVDDFELLIEPALAEGDASLLIVDVGGLQLNFSDRNSIESELNLTSGRSIVVWKDTGLSWSRLDVIRLALKTTNLSAGGAPVIREAPRVDEVLTVDTSGITDGNGIPDDVVFSYQWFYRDADEDRDFPGATRPSFPLDPSHLGKRIGVKVSFTDAGGYVEQFVIDPTSAVGERAYTFWTSTATVVRTAAGTLDAFGYSPGAGYPGSALTDKTATYRSNTYTVELIQLFRDSVGLTNLGIRFEEVVPDDAVDVWVLDVGGREFLISSAFASISNPGRAFSFNNTGLSWSGGDIIPLALKALNSPAQGVVVAGEPGLGNTLTADTSGISDANGVPVAVTFSYQWVSSDAGADADIPGATGPSYTITGDEPSNLLKVRVGFTDSRGFMEAVTSSPVVWPHLGELWVAGMTVGRSDDLDENGFGRGFDEGALTDTTFAYAGKSYTFVRVSVASDGSLTLVLEPELTEGDADQLILEAAGNQFYFRDRTGSHSSLNLHDDGSALIVWTQAGLSWYQGDAIRLALRADNQPAEGVPIIKGAPRVDDVLTADTSGISDGNGIPENVVFSYQWVDGATLQDIPGATGPSLSLDSSHLGLAVGVRVSFTDAGGYEESLPSDITAAVRERAHKFWTSTLTATGSPDLEPLRVVGYPEPLFPGSSLTDPAVTYGPTSYSVESISLTGSDETSLVVRFSQAPSQGEIDTWILDVDGTEYFLSRTTSQSTSAPDRTFIWESSGLSWSYGDVLSLALKTLNQPAQGVGITGEPGVGNTLTADPSGITDPDGVPEGVAFTYQWVSFEGVAVRDIPGATGPSYTITRDRGGDVLGVRVGFTDSLGFREIVTSGPVVSPQSRELWVAALTVGRNAALNQDGFGDGFAGGALTDATFSHAGKDYTFSSISHDSNGALQLLLEPELTELDANLLDFYIRANPFHFSNRSSSESSLDLNDSGQALIVWAGAGLIWSQGEVIRLALKAANQPAEGMPVIKGAPRVDDVLTADTSAITDGNGIPGDVVFSYQWFDGATLQDIPGATGATLPLDSSYLDLTIGVRVGFTDAEGYEESVTSEVTTPVEERAFKFWTSTLTATELPGSPIPNVGYPYPGSSLSEATVTFGAIAYSVERISLTGSDETSLVVRFSQAPSQGEIDAWILDVDGTEYFLSQTTSQSTSDPDRTFIWESSGLSWSDGDVLSLALKVLNQPAEGRPSISGTRKFGETLTAGTSGITDPNGIPDGAVFTYQWFTVVVGAETDIPGANGPGYTIPRDREGDFLRVRVGFTDSHGFDESVTSEEVVWRKAGEIWAALLTVGYNPGPNTYGFGTGYAGGSLSETLFRYFNKNLTIFRLRVNNFDNEINLILRLSLSEEEADVLTFRAGSKLLAFSNRASKSTLASGNQSILYWSNFGLTWSKGNKFRVALSAANQGVAGTAVLRGEAKVGRILTVDPSGITDPNGIPGDVVFTYQWIRCAGVSLSCEDIPGANGSSYQLTEADEDSFVGVRLSFHDSLGYPEETVSTVVGPVEARSNTAGQHLLDSAQTDPRGVWGNADTIWVANSRGVVGVADRIVAYNRSDLSRDSSKDFDPLHASNAFSFGIWSDGETMYVVDRSVKKVYAYRMKDDPGTDEVDEFGARDPDKDITLSSQNGDPTGIWGNSETIWVANNPTTGGALDKIFAYTLVDDPATTTVEQYGARDQGKDLNGLNSAGNNDPRGIWSDGESMFVVNRKPVFDDFITGVFAYRLSNGGRFSQRDIKLAEANGHPAGAWGDDGELWVVDDGVTSRGLFRYFLPYPATGQPTILGNLVVGQTLTADVSGIADRNGLPDAFDYQWYRSDGTNDTAIDGATGSSYLLTDSDLGGSIRVKVSFFDEHSYEETLFSDRTRPLNAPATGEPSPSLATTLLLSASLTARSAAFFIGYSSLGSLGDGFGSLSPSTFTVDGTSYTLVALTVSSPSLLQLVFDKELDADFELTLDDASFSSGAVSSAGQAMDSSVYGYEWDDSALSWSDRQVISVSLRLDAARSPAVGDTLRAGISDIVDRNGLPDAFAYQWRRYEGDQGTPISGATEGVYVLAPEDTGHQIGFRVSFTDDDGFSESLDSSLTPVVNDPAKGKPTISGDLEVGQTLMADASAVTDRNGLPAAFTYQWFRLDGDAWIAIPGATGSTYTLVADDRGHRIMVRVTFTDGDGFQEEVDSVPTMGVELINQPATGKPTVTVSGDLKTGSTLTADISGIADPNGLPDVFSYQWSRGEGSGFSPFQAPWGLLTPWPRRTAACKSGSK